MNYRLIGVMAFILSFVYPTHQIQAGNPFESIFKEIIGDVRDKIQNEVTTDIGDKLSGFRLNVIRKNAAKQRYSAVGYCQVWQSDVLAVQKKCKIKQYCSNDGTCVRLYVWPNRAQTEMIYKDGTADSLNGMATSLIEVGNDRCYADGLDGDLFCYTRTAQSKDLMLANSDVDDEIDQEITITNDVTTLLSNYADAAEEGDTVVARKRRCVLGKSIMINHSEALEKDVKAFILDQLIEDGCLG